MREMKDIAYQSAHLSSTPSDSYAIWKLKPIDSANSASNITPKKWLFFINLSKVDRSGSKIKEVTERYVLNSTPQDTINQLRADAHNRSSELVKVGLPLTEASMAQDKAINHSHRCKQ
ncbi:hypothetical protein QVD17_37867 [Tagetes erecta]|uniref:Uncharacterized protein n=1 Tax=Tagetes erecta TaxID=13708 RepID=A0AAD8NIT9_TARER|nr:hypothetical protein QVD17_37867 [Tagetes erecta]